VNNCGIKFQTGSAKLDLSNGVTLDTFTLADLDGDGLFDTNGDLLLTAASALTITNGITRVSIDSTNNLHFYVPGGSHIDFTGTVNNFFGLSGGMASGAATIIDSRILTTSAISALERAGATNQGFLSSQPANGSVTIYSTNVAESGTLDVTVINP
jgi:hypothetical protein